MTTPLLKRFLSEAESLSGIISDGLMILEKDPQNQEVINDVFRAMHTIKGSSGVVEGTEALTKLLHASEDLLDGVRSGQITFEAEMANAIFETLDVMQEWLQVLEQQASLPKEAMVTAHEVGGRVRALIPESAQKPSSSSKAPAYGASCAWLQNLPASIKSFLKDLPQPLTAITYTPAGNCFFSGEDPLGWVMDIPNVCWSKIYPLQPWGDLVQVDPYACNVAFHVVARTSLEDIQQHGLFILDQLCLETITSVSFEKDERESPSAEEEVALNILTAQVNLLKTAGDNEDLQLKMQSALPVMDRLLKTIFYEETLYQDTLSLFETTQDLEGFLQGLESMIACVHGRFSPTVPPEPLQVKDEESSLLISDDESPSTAKVVSTQAPKTSKKLKELKVDQSRIDTLMNLSAELVVAKNALPFLAKRAEESGYKQMAVELKEKYQSLNRIVEDVQNAVMQIRMVPVSVIFQQFPRLVRDLSRKLGKQVNLVIQGENTEADKNVIEDLADPLIHMIRNSLDHGLETPDERESRGKSPTGVLQLMAFPEDDHVIIEIRDDGRGIAVEKVRQKAYEKGLITEEQSSSMTADDIKQLIFAPGFSTADAISDVSGRGVGMDAVRHAIHAAGGSIAVFSEEGKGTTVRLSLPLAMSMSRIMIIEVQGQRYGIPIEWVLETVRIPHSHIHAIKAHRVTVLRGEVIPLVCLSSAFDMPQSFDGQSRNDEAILVVQVDGQKMGLIVNRFHENVEVILKPLEGLLGAFKHFSGTALMGDGSVLLVINLRNFCNAHNLL